MHYKQQNWYVEEGLNFFCAIPVLSTLTHLLGLLEVITENSFFLWYVCVQNYRFINQAYNACS